MAGGLGSMANAAQPEKLDPATSTKIEFTYEAIVTLGPTEVVGATPFGKRVRIPITGGHFKGPRIRGTIFPEGMDWQLVRADGYTVIEASYLMREADGTVIHIHNKGIVGEGYARTSPIFEVPLGPHQWLNQSIFTGLLGPAPEVTGPAVQITVFRLV